MTNAAQLRAAASDAALLASKRARGALSELGMAPRRRSGSGLIPAFEVALVDVDLGGWTDTLFLVEAREVINRAQNSSHEELKPVWAATPE